MRGGRYILIFCFILLADLNSIAQELWRGIKWEKELMPKLETELKIQIENYLNSSTYLAENCYIQSGLSYELVTNFYISGTIRYTGCFEIEDNKNDSYEDKLRFTAELTYKTNRFKNDIRFSNRIRYQYSREDADDEKIYIRNKLKCDYKLTKRTKPYFSVEPFYSIDKRVIKSYRLYMGCEFKILKNKLDVFIIHKIENKDWIFSSNQVIGFLYKF